MVYLYSLWVANMCTFLWNSTQPSESTEQNKYLTPIVSTLVVFVASHSKASEIILQKKSLFLTNDFILIHDFSISLASIFSIFGLLIRFFNDKFWALCGFTRLLLAEKLHSLKYFRLVCFSSMLFSCFIYQWKLAVTKDPFWFALSSSLWMLYKGKLG